MIKLSFYDSAPLMSFPNQAALKDFCKKQKSDWSNLMQGPTDRSFVYDSSQSWNNLIASINSTNADELRFQEVLQGYLDRKPCVPCSSRLGQYLINTDGNREEIIKFFTKVNDYHNKGINTNVEDIRNVIRAILVVSGPEHLSKGVLEKNATQGFAELENRFGQMSQKWDAEATNKISQVENAKKRLISLNSEWSRKRKEIAADVSAQINSANQSWEALKFQFHEELKTKTAVELWSTRASDKKDEYVVTRRWAVGVGVIGLLLTIIWLLGGPGLISYFTTDKTFQLGVFITATVTYFTIYVWALRVVVRNMMVANHLALDAQTRSAMAHTYLALMKDGAASEKDRAIILAALFNPVSNGLVTDDAMPMFSPTGIVASKIIGN